MSSTATPGSSDAGEQPAPSSRIDQGEKKQQPSTEGRVRNADYDSKMQEILKQQEKRRRMAEQMRSGTSDPPSQSNPSIMVPFPYLLDMCAGRQNKPDQPAAGSSGTDKRGAEPPWEGPNVLMEQLASLESKLQYVMRRADDTADMVRKLSAEVKEMGRARPPARDNVEQERTERTECGGAAGGARDRVEQGQTERPTVPARDNKADSHAAAFVGVAIYYLLMLSALYQMPQNAPNVLVTAASWCIVLVFLSLPFAFVMTAPQQP